MVRVGIVTARVAVLVDHYHLTLREIGDLTDRQIKEVYFHARTKEGAIDIPLPPVDETPVPDTEERLLADLAVLRGANLITEDNYRQCVADAKRRFRGEG